MGGQKEITNRRGGGRSRTRGKKNESPAEKKREREESPWA